MRLLAKLAIVGLALLLISCCCIDSLMHDEDVDLPLDWGTHGEGRGDDV